MSDLLQILPIYAFMLIPVWIPLAAITIGALSDAIRGPVRRVAPARRAVRTAGPRVPAAGTAR
jgi:hypothetical protein